MILGGCTTELRKIHESRFGERLWKTLKFGKERLCGVGHTHEATRLQLDP